ncbi:Zinc finger protein Xfin, partial [Cyphomyrmex costatus]
CDICPKRFKSKYLLKLHKVTHMAEIMHGYETDVKENSAFTDAVPRNQILSCVTCDFRCDKRSTMIAHLAEEHDGIANNGRFASDKRKLTCLVCGLVCARKETLRSHFIRKHTQHYAYSCEHCGKGFKIKGDLTTHIRLNHQEMPVVCGICDKTCRNSHSLYTHQKHAHYKAKYECPLCHRRLVTKQNLDQHVLTQHEKKEKSVCEQCGKTFFENYDLRKHMRSHTGDKPYNCMVCGRAFARHCNLSQHLLLHTGKRIYACDVCGKTFAQKAGLICHRKIHSGSAFNPRGIFIFGNESLVMKKWQILEFDDKPYYAFVPEGDIPIPDEDILYQTDEEVEVIENENIDVNDIKQDYSEGEYDCTEEKSYNVGNVLNENVDETEDVKPITLNGEAVDDKTITSLYQVKIEAGTVTIEKLTSKEEVDEKTNEDQTENVNDDEGEIEYLDEALLDVPMIPPPSKASRMKTAKNSGEAVRCKLCSEKFDSILTFRKHVAWTHKRKVCIIDNDFYVCSVCGFKTPKKSLFAAHLERKHETWSKKRSINTKFPCNACGFVCRSKHSLQSHFTRKHTDKYEHQCNFCSKKFKVKGDLTNHIRFHHKEKPVKCDVCGKLCLNSGSLYVHQKWAHYKPKYECHICKRRMVTQANLDQHLVTQHEKRDKIVCAECGKTFAKKDSFKRHMVVHTGCKPHSCMICSKPFARRSQLRQHLLIHTGKRPFVCDICGKAFTQKPGLICHRKTHPGQHPPLPVMPIADYVKEFTDGYVQEINAQDNEEDINEEVVDPLNVEDIQKSFVEIECEQTEREKLLIEREGRLSEINGNLMREELNPQIVTEENRSTRKKTTCVECDYCRRKFLKKSNLAEHLKQHRHKCVDCPKTFSLRRYLASHVEKNHRQQMYECSVCKYKSNNKGTLKNHYIRLHTSNYDYACDTCGKQFKIKKALNHHVKQNHSEAPPIVCDVCGHFSKNLHALKAHMKYRHYKPEFVCRICRRGMTTQENLEQHLMWHETREKVLCPTCGKRFRGRDLDSHMRVHTGVKPFPCPVCGKTFRRQTAQEQHVLIHTGKRPYICDICGQTFAQKPGLICHRKRHPGPLPPLPVVSIKNIVTEFTKDDSPVDPLTVVDANNTEHMSETIECLSEYELLPNKIKQYIVRRERKMKNDTRRGKINQNRIEKKKPKLSFECATCGQCFNQKATMIKHMSLHKYQCQTCCQSFGLKRELKRHIMNVHGPLLYPCSICDYKSNNKCTLKDHFIRKHTSGYQHSCTICNKQFKIKNDLKQHMNQVHSGEPPIICSICGHACKNVPAIKAHMKYRHYKPAYECKICKRGLTTQEYLDQHLIWHERKEKVVCPTCGKTFGQKRDLDLHLRIHQGIRPFSCPVCGKTFPRKTAQEQHILIHTGKKPYICDICGHTFAQKPGLICHRKRHPGPLPPLPVVSIKKIIMEFMQELISPTQQNKVDNQSRHVHQCVKCGDRFYHTRKLVEHLKNLHNIDRAFSCDECGKTFRSPMNITRHKLIHTGLKTYKCDVCEYSSNQRSNMECHRRRHTKDYLFKCEKCDKGFFYRADYQEHQNTHNKKNMYRCDHCCKPYKYKKNLRVHLATYHLRHAVARNPRTRYACKVCPESFMYKRLLDNHIKSQHGSTNKSAKHLCDLCGTKLSSMRRLIVHQRSHTGERIFECGTCHMKFFSKENLSIHQRTHTGEKPHVCVQCRRGFSQRTALVYHLRYQHSGQKPYQCPDCGKGFVSNALLKRHHRMHEKTTAQWTNNHDLKMKNGNLLDLGQKFEDGEKICDLCQAKFHFVTRLVAHLRIAHGIHRPFECVTCGKNYPQQFMLNAHVKKSHTPKTVPCTQCSFMGVSVTDVEKHKRRRHRVPEFTCEICSEDFVDKDALIAHTATHDLVQRCNACDSIFNDVYSLKEHNRLYHYDPASDEKLDESSENESEHKCDVCGKIYKYRSLLKQHKVRTHGDPSNYERRKYLCALCGKELKTAKGLEIHNRSHTGEKPYTCEVCGKCFACDTMLRTHNVTHTGERKYSCDQCGKAFTQRSTLVVHKRYHTGERPYVCPRCNKGFITRTVLNTHMKSCR